MAVERDVFGISGPTYLKSIDWYVFNSSSYLRQQDVRGSWKGVGFAESSTFTCFEKDVPHDL
jgi:hypothetical protein